MTASLYLYSWTRWRYVRELEKLPNATAWFHRPSEHAKACPRMLGSSADKYGQSIPCFRVIPMTPFRPGLIQRRRSSGCERLLEERLERDRCRMEGEDGAKEACVDAMLTMRGFA